MSWRQTLGRFLLPRLPVTRHVFNHLRLETRAAALRLRERIDPFERRRYRALAKRRGLLVNVGCGPFGIDGWVNLDLDAHPCVTLSTDCRRRLPLGDSSAKGIHAEHYVEHLDPSEELTPFLKDCLRVLEPGGVLRLIVPDARRYLEAYVQEGWGALESVTCGGDSPRPRFETKMDVVNHVFLQEWEHYGGFDFERLAFVLRRAGFIEVTQTAWRTGAFPGGCIDREQHRPYSLYVEARRPL